MPQAKPADFPRFSILFTLLGIPISLLLSPVFILPALGFAHRWFGLLVFVSSPICVGWLIDWSRMLKPTWPQRLSVAASYLLAVTIIFMKCHIVDAPLDPDLLANLFLLAAMTLGAAGYWRIQGIHIAAAPSRGWTVIEGLIQAEEELFIRLETAYGFFRLPPQQTRALAYENDVRIEPGQRLAVGGDFLIENAEGNAYRQITSFNAAKITHVHESRKQLRDQLMTRTSRRVLTLAVLGIVLMLF